jgi:hypothetical protein
MDAKTYCIWLKTRGTRVFSCHQLICPRKTRIALFYGTEGLYHTFKIIYHQNNVAK